MPEKRNGNAPPMIAPASVMGSMRLSESGVAGSLYE
jgi:hypothetical protein